MIIKAQSIPTKKTLASINVRRATKKFLAFGCSHGHFINKSIADDLEKWKQEYRPDTVLCLGDFLDMTAFRQGAMAPGAQDESSDITDDVIIGLNFVERMEPDYLFLGNHEARAWRLMSHHKSLIALAARSVVDSIEDLASSMKAEVVPYSGTRDPHAWRMLGDVAFGHGIMYGQNACEQHAWMLGHHCCFVHTHAIEVRTSRTQRQHIGYNIGLIGDINRLGRQYADQRLATTRWMNGWAFGEYNDNFCQLEIHRCRTTEQEIPRIL